MILSPSACFHYPTLCLPAGAEIPGRAHSWGPLCHLKGEGPLCSASVGVTTLKEGDHTDHSMHLPLWLRGHLPEGHGKCSAEHVCSHCLVCAVTGVRHTQMLCWLSWAPWAAVRGHPASSPHRALDHPAQGSQMPEHLPVASAASLSLLLFLLLWLLLLRLLY